MEFSLSTVETVEKPPHRKASRVVRLWTDWSFAH